MHRFISQELTSLTDMNSNRGDGAATRLGIKLTAVGPDFIAGEMPVDERTVQPYGLLHGGASVVLAETLGSYASQLLFGDEPEVQVVGIEVSGSHVRGAKEGLVTGVARPVKLGRNIHFWRIDISDAAGQLVCAARLTVTVLRGR